MESSSDAERDDWVSESEVTEDDAVDSALSSRSRADWKEWMSGVRKDEYTLVAFLHIVCSLFDLFTKVRNLFVQC